MKRTTTDEQIVFMYKEGIKNPGEVIVLPNKDFERLIEILNSKSLIKKYDIVKEWYYGTSP